MGMKGSGVERLNTSDQERILREQEESGQSVAAYSRAHGLDPQVIYGWRKQRQRRTSSSSMLGKFATVQTGIAATTTVTVELPGSSGGLRVVAPIELLQAVVRELAGR